MTCDPLDSPRYMVARAKHHIAELEAQVETFLGSSPTKIFIEIDLNTREEVHKARLVKPLPVMLNGIASDAVTNLRGALDQIGYVTSVAAGGRGKNTYFPIRCDETGVKGAKAKPGKKPGPSEEIPDEIFAVMLKFKPYKGGNDSLWALNELANANKHRLLRAVGIATAGIETRNLEMQGGARFAKPMRWDSDKSEMEIARVPEGGYIDYDFVVPTFVVFNEPEVLTPYPADAVLNGMASEVESVLMAVEIEARRIKLAGFI